MKLKRIFMTGVLASSMLALAACGDDAEGKKTEEEKPVETEKEKEKEDDPVQPVDPVEPEEDKFTLSDALTALNNFSIEGYLQNLVDIGKDMSADRTPVSKVQSAEVFL